MARILVLNLGSTSFKFKLYEMNPGEEMIATGGVECIKTAGSYSITVHGEKHKDACSCSTHMEALELCLQLLSEYGIEIDIGSLDAIGYKAVHGGTISEPHVVDEFLLSEMERMVSFAPAHNPLYIGMMQAVRKKYPAVKQIACFETAFHTTMPKERAVYGVPCEWVEKYGVRRYGYHGSSHSYIAWKMKQEVPQARRVISVHLGGSSSICAILDGKSVATSMGATPQSGLFHNNRVGDMDVFCLSVLADEFGGMENVLNILTSQSGFLGLSGVSNDLRNVEKAAAEGNPQAQLALDAFVDEIVGFIGQYIAYLGGVDAICFTGGIGLNAAQLRQAVADRLSYLGVKLDPQKNIGGYEGCITDDDSQVQLWSLETNEEVMIARGCMKVLNA